LTDHCPRFAHFTLFTLFTLSPPLTPETRPLYHGPEECDENPALDLRCIDPDARHGLRERCRRNRLLVDGDEDGQSFPLTFTFKQDGATLTGTVQGPQGDPIAISNGKIDGNAFSFDVSFNGMTIHHNCTVAGDDEIKMTTKSDSGDFPSVELTLNRVKQAAPSAPGVPDAPVKPTPPPQ
jgi:hypothetical protein